MERFRTRKGSLDFKNQRERVILPRSRLHTISHVSMTREDKENVPMIRTEYKDVYTNTHHNHTSPLPCPSTAGQVR